MQININDRLYSQLFAYAQNTQTDIDELIEQEMRKLIEKQSHQLTLTFTPHSGWPKGMFAPYGDNSFPDVHELRADLLEQKSVEL